jgi:hypothetical protein
VLALQGDLPGGNGLFCITWADDLNARDAPKREQGFDRLVRRPILAEIDAVVREDVDALHFHQSR